MLARSRRTICLQDLPDHRDSAKYVAKGVKPADLRVAQPTRFELTLNTTAATARGVSLPHALLVRADKIIE